MRNRLSFQIVASAMASLPCSAPSRRVETSSHGILSAPGNVDTTAPGGSAGEWLLDPANVEITSATTSGDPFTNPYTPTFDGTSQITATSVTTALGSGNVTIQASGTITISSGLGYVGSNTLTLTATSVSASANISFNNAGNGRGGLTINAASFSATGTYTLNTATLTLNPGSGNGHDHGLSD